MPDRARGAGRGRLCDSGRPAGADEVDRRRRCLRGSRRQPRHRRQRRARSMSEPSRATTGLADGGDLRARISRWWPGPLGRAHHRHRARRCRSHRGHPRPRPRLAPALPRFVGASGSTRGRARIFYLNTRSVRQWARLIRELRRRRLRPALRQQHVGAGAVAASGARIGRAGSCEPREVLVAPRGELADGAMSVEVPKEAAWRCALLRPMFRRADVIWHASTDLEAAQIRAQFPQLRIQICMMEVSRATAVRRASDRSPKTS